MFDVFDQSGQLVAPAGRWEDRRAASGPAGCRSAIPKYLHCAGQAGRSGRRGAEEADGFAGCRPDQCAARGAGCTAGRSVLSERLARALWGRDRTTTAAPVGRCEGQHGNAGGKCVDAGGYRSAATRASPGAAQAGSEHAAAGPGHCVRANRFSSGSQGGAGRRAACVAAGTAYFTGRTAAAAGRRGSTSGARCRGRAGARALCARGRDNRIPGGCCKLVATGN